MDAGLRHKLLIYLSGAAIALSSGSIESSRAELTEIPEPIMAELVDEVDGDGWRVEDVTILADLLADDPRARIRQLAAELATATRIGLSGADLEPILIKLAGDVDPVVRSTLVRGVTDWLRRCPEMERARAVLEWASADSPQVRRTIAGSLALGVDALGADLAVEHLAADEAQSVRLAVVEAAGRRYQDDPAFYAGILHQLARDSVPTIREQASWMMKRLVGLA